MESLLGWVRTQSSPLWLDITGMSLLSFPPVELFTTNSYVMNQMSKFQVFIG